MSIRKRIISVHQIPNQISSSTQMELLRRLEMSVQSGHPRLVLDCSKVETMGMPEMRFLLSYLEEVMKHNGDVRLAVPHPEAKAVLKTAGLSRLFEIFDTTESAVASYQSRPASMAPLYSEVAKDQDSEYAA